MNLWLKFEIYRQIQLGKLIYIKDGYPVLTRWMNKPVSTHFGSNLSKSYVFV